MPELKNARHEAFVQEYVKDGNATRSYKAVYGEEVKGAKQSARNLLELATVQERLVEVRTELAVRTGMSQDQIVQDLQAVYETGMANPERGGLAAAQQSKGQQAKILGYTDQKSKQNAEDLSDEEMVKQYREGTGNDRLADLLAAALKHSRGHDITADLDKIEADLRQAVAISTSNGKDKQPPATPGSNGGADANG